MELETLVEESGHIVVGWAASSDEALKMIDQVEADIAFVDIHLTDGATGVDVARYIQEKQFSKVIFMTANPKRIPENFVGAVGVIAKPYTLNGLVASLRYLQEGIRRPPPDCELPVGFTLSPTFASSWAN